MAKEKAVASPPVKTGGRKFNKAQLRAHCQELFGVSPVVFDGALFDLQEEITKNEAKQRIEAWLNQSVGTRPEREK